MRDALVLKNRLVSMQQHTRKLRHKAGEAVRDAVHLGEVALAAGGMGWWAGKRSLDAAATEGPNIFGVPADLASGVVAYGLAWMGVAGAEEHFKSLGDGFFGAYFSTVGYEYGKGVKGWKPPKVLGTGTPDYGRRVSGESLTAEDLARLAAKG